MRSQLQNMVAALAVAIVAAAVFPAAPTAQPMNGRDPLEVAKVLAARYPAQPIMSYIPALSWSGQLRLSALTGEPRWREKALKDIHAFTSGKTPAIAEPHRLTSLAGALAFADAGSIAGDRAAGELALKVADFISPEALDGSAKFATGWTDDMFMASTVLARAKTPRHAAAARRILLAYSSRLQRDDGLYVHAENAPHAWGRGNGFALLGVTEALTHLPDEPQDRANLLPIYQRHVNALAKHQSDDGSWRQVVDEPESYRELTVTAMTVAAMARGISRGCHDEDVFTNPDTFDITRDPNPHLAFGGHGAHYCVGANLARLEVEVMFHAIADRLPDIAKEGEAQRLRHGWINGIKELPVKYA